MVSRLPPRPKAPTRHARKHALDQLAESSRIDGVVAGRLCIPQIVLIDQAARQAVSLLGNVVLLQPCHNIRLSLYSAKADLGLLKLFD